MDRQAVFFVALLFLADFRTIKGETGMIYHVLVTGKPLTLPCNTTLPDTIYWQLNRKNISDNKSHYEFLENGKQLAISNPVPSIFGNYTCKQNIVSPDFLSFHQVIDAPIANVIGNSYVDKGGKLQLTCEIIPDNLGPEITWIFGNASYTTSKGRVNLTKDHVHGVDNAVLAVDNISMADGGPVHCHATFKNVVGDTQAEGHVNIIVEDKDATFRRNLGIGIGLGVAAAVSLLCVMILVLYYKEKRKKAELGRSDTDKSAETSSSSPFIPLSATHRKNTCSPS